MATWNSNPVQLDHTNKGPKNADAAENAAVFYFQTSTALTLGIAEITFPTGFDISGTTTAAQVTASGTGTIANPVISGQMIQISGLTFAADTDNWIRVEYGSNPTTEGGYGPFMILTRHYAEGQIQDINKVFGSVGIVGDEGTLSSVSVGFPTTSLDTVGATSATLQFTFIINQDMWKYDVVKLTVDSRFGVTPGAVCTSVAYSSGLTVNFLNEFDNNSPTIPCEVVGQYVYVYGLSKMLDISSGTQIGNTAITVSSITNPDAAYSGVYTWYVETMRFQTGTVLERGTYGSGPTVQPGSITQATFTPTWGNPVNSIAPGMQLLMDTSVTITNAVAANGIVNFSTSGTQSTAAPVTNYYVYTYVENLTCAELSDNNLRWTAGNALTAGSSITCRIHATFVTTVSATIGLNTVESFTAVGGTKIDTSSGTLGGSNTLQAAAAGDLLSTLVFYLASSNSAGNDSAGAQTNSANQYFKFDFISEYATAPTAGNIRVYCPLTTSGVQPTQWYFASDSTGGIAHQAGASFTDVTAGTVIGGVTTTVTSASDINSEGNVRLGFSSASITQNHRVLGFWNNSNAGTFIANPAIISNNASKYECRVEYLSDTAGSITYRDARVLTITAATVTTFNIRLNAVSTAPTVGASAEARVTIQVGNRYSIPADSSDYTYHIEFNLDHADNDLGSGLSTNDDYPLFHDSAVANQQLDSGMTLKLTANKQLTVGSFGTFDTAANDGIFYFVVEQENATLSGQAYEIYRIPVNGDMTIKEIFFTGNSADVAYGDTGFAAGTAGTDRSGSALANAAENQSFTFTCDTGGTGTDCDGAANDRIIATFPSGWKVASGAFSTLDGTAVAESNKRVYNHPTSRVFALPTIAADVDQAFTQTAVFTGIDTRRGVQANTTINVYLTLCDASFGDQDLLTNSIDTGTNAFATTVVTIVASTISVTPSNIRGEGPGEVDQSYELGFTLAEGIDLGGKIDIVLNNGQFTHSGWTTMTLTSGGLTAAAAGGSVAITDNGSNSFTINGFAEFNTSQALRVSFAHINGPTNASNSGVDNTVDFLSSITTSCSVGGADANIETVSGSSITQDNITVRPANANGTSTFVTISAMPQHTSQTNAHLYLEFSLASALPAYSVIQITPPSSVAIVGVTNEDMNRVWCNYIHDDVAISGGVLSIRIREAYNSNDRIMIHVDRGIATIPSSTAATSDGYSVISSWNGVTVDTDAAVTATTERKFAATAAITGTLTKATTQLSFSPQNAGEYATYTFSFSSNQDFLSTDKILIEFPDEFDPFFGGGAGEWFVQESDIYYVHAESSALGSNVWAMVDHWKVYVTGDSTITAGDNISISLMMIKNPASGAATGNFRVAHLDSTGSYKSYDDSFGTVTPTSQNLTNIPIRMLSVSNHYLFNSSSDYTFEFYLPNNVSTNEQLRVYYPYQYALRRCDGKSKYTCETSYDIENQTGVAQTENLSWNTNTECDESNNWLTLDPPNTSQTFSNDNPVTLTVKAVGNPEWGEERKREASTRPGMDQDIRDPNTAFPVYDVWTERFSLYLYNTSSSSLSYTAKSYGVLNSAYLGFDYQYRQLVVNDFTMLTSRVDRLVVWAGSQSQEYAISTHSTTYPVSAKVLELTPTINATTPDSSNLTFTSWRHSFKLYQEMISINFRVGAKVNTTKGLYYIDWAVKETKQDISSKSIHYHPPVKTLVEVVAKVAKKYKFAVEQLAGSIPIGRASVPLGISISNPPAEKVDIALTVTGNTAGVSVSPSSITFGPDQTIEYFRISIDDTFASTATSAQTLTFTLSGTDSEVYDIDATYSFTVTTAATTSAEQVAGNISSWGTPSCQKTSCSLSPTVDQISFLYWEFRAKVQAGPEGDCASQDSLESEVDDWVSERSNADFEDYNDFLNQLHDDFEYEPVSSSSESWIEFQHRIYKEHRQIKAYGGVNYYSTQIARTVSFDWLWASTEYQICGRTENVYGNWSNYTWTSFSTQTKDINQPWSVTFSGDVNSSLSASINNEVSYYMGVNPSRNYWNDSTGRTTITGTNNTVTSTKFTYTLLADRDAELPTTSDIANIVNTESFDYLDVMKTQLATITSATFDTYTRETDASAATPGFSDNRIEITDTEENSLSIKVNPSIDGEVACIALKGTQSDFGSDSNTTKQQLRPTAIQVFLGIGRDNMDAPNDSETSDRTNGNTLTISGLDDDTDYCVFCTATDTYLLWPNLPGYTDSSPIPIDCDKTDDDSDETETESDSSALFLSSNVTAVVLMLIALVFN